MKKRSMMILCMVAAMTLTACGSRQPAETAVSTEAQTESETPTPTETSTETAEANAAAGSNILIAYFTVPETDGVDTVAGASRVVVDGKCWEIISISPS